MANKFTPISAISGGKKDIKLIVHVAHIWLICDKENPDDIIFMNMMLVEEKRGRIHATVRKYLVPTIQKMVEEGGTYKLENVMVGFNKGQYRLLPHKHKLSMMNNARFAKVNAPNIPRNVFEFMAFKDILLSHEEDKVADVIGHVVERDSLRETEKNERKSLVIDLMLEDLEHSRIHCSLWGEFATDIDKYFETHDNFKHVVFIITTWAIVEIIINGDLPEVADYRERMGNVVVELTQGVSHMSSYSARPVAEELLDCN
ncbi:DUF223 domain protein [Medicago truncatula]|uniref:DUF223 domain protein n=1 Tax=Medicago truncatula TaxID=3880 RepID=G7KIJ4_MEDTR|nr:DUF223 domain protein [Medicago truncatula]AES78780.1 DUF223 domain protein [Medicago truncatula]